MASRQVFLLLLVAVSFLLKVAVAMSVDVPAHQNECFYEDLEVGDRLTLTFYVRLKTKMQEIIFTFISYRSAMVKTHPLMF